MSPGEKSRGHMSLETSHSSSSIGGFHESRGCRSQNTSQSTSINCEGCGHRSSLTRQSSFSNRRGFVDRGGSKLQDTSHSSSQNQVTIFDIEGRGEYRYHTIHYTPLTKVNMVDCWFWGDTVGGDVNMEHTSSLITIFFPYSNFQL